MAIDPLGRPATVLRPYDAQNDALPIARMQIDARREAKKGEVRDALRNKMTKVKALEYAPEHRQFFQKAWDDIHRFYEDGLNKGFDPSDESDPRNREWNDKLLNSLVAIEEAANLSNKQDATRKQHMALLMGAPDKFNTTEYSKMIDGFINAGKDEYGFASPLADRNVNWASAIRPPQFDVNKFIRDNVTNLEGATVTDETPNVAAGTKTTTVRLPKEKIDNRWVIMEDAMRQGNVPDETIEKAKTDFYSSFGRKDQTELLPKSDEWSYGDGGAKGKGIIAKRGTYTIGGTNTPGASETPQGGAAPGAVQAQAIELSGDGKNIPPQSVSFTSAVKLDIKGKPGQVTTTTIDDFTPVRIYKTPYGKIFMQGTGKYEEKGVLKSGQMEFEVDSNNKQLVETKFLPGTVEEFFDKTAPKKTATKAQIKSLVGKQGYEGYTEAELVDYYKTQGYDVSDDPIKPTNKQSGAKSGLTVSNTKDDNIQEIRIGQNVLTKIPGGAKITAKRKGATQSFYIIGYDKDGNKHNYGIGGDPTSQKVVEYLKEIIEEDGIVDFE